MGNLGIVSSSRQPDVRYLQAVLSLGPVAYWRLGESSGTAAVDAVAAHNGLYVNTPTLGVTGALVNDTNTAVLFTPTGSSATNPLVSVTPPSGALDIGDTFTIALWVKRTTTGVAFHYMLRAGWSAGYALDFLSTDSIRLEASGTAFIADSTRALTDTTKWHQIVATKNGATAATIYIDGTASGNTFTNGTVANQGSGTLYFGGRSDGSLPVDAALDEVAIWSRVLSAAEVSKLWQTGTRV